MIGYNDAIHAFRNRAARIIERMETAGVVSQANRDGRREVLISNGGDHAV